MLTTFKRFTYLFFIIFLLVVPEYVFSVEPAFYANLEDPGGYISPYPRLTRSKVIISLYYEELPILNRLFSTKPKVIRSSFDNQSLTFGGSYYKRRMYVYNYTDRSADAEEYSKQRRYMFLNQKLQEIQSQSLTKEQRDKRGGLLQVNIPIKSKVMESIAGEGGVGLRVSGSHRITFSGRSQWDDRQQTTLYQQSRFPSLNMEQISRFEINGTIGTKITVSVSQDSKVNIPLANRLMIRFKGDEDDVIKTIEAGNTTLSLPNTQFVGYSTRIKGLFGIKTEAQIGGLKITAIASQEKGNTERSSVEAGSSATTNKPIRDYQYLKGKIFDLGLPEHFDPGDVIEEIRVYVSKTPLPGGVVEGDSALMYFNPDSLSEDTTMNIDRVVEELGSDKFWTNTKEHWIMFDNTSSVLGKDVGVYMIIRKAAPDSTVYYDTVGNIFSDPYILKLISPNAQLSRDPTWQYMWRNVYLLRGGFGSSQLELDGLEINILKGEVNTENTGDNLDHQGGIPYIQIFGLDQTDENGKLAPDNLVDIYTPIIDAENGLLIFPNREPFNMDSVYVQNKWVKIGKKVPEIYTMRHSDQEAQSNSTYYIEYSTKRRQAEIRLGKTNIIEGSERVLINGRQGEKGKDYKIMYGTGTVTLLSDDALDPNAEISIDFEYTPFILAQKKSLFGIRGEYEISRNLRFGATFLYKSDKATERKPRIGQETSRMIVWDADISFKIKPSFITSLANALPFYTTETPSNLAVSAEVAQSLPNPNVDGIAYIDDFEGSRESYSLGIFREDWHYASKPVGLDDSRRRAKMLWYNPYEQTRTQDIWNREIAAGEGLSHTLKLEYRPNVIDRRLKIDTSLNAIEDSTTSWAGIMRGFSRGLEDQSKAQLLEIRVKGDYGILHFDFGEISEDADGDGESTTEDTKPPFNSLNDDEDVGLDGMIDAEEQFYYNMPDSADPSGDNWHYDPEINYNDYENINGTQGNASDPGTLGFPDHEEINSDGSVNKDKNNYFTYRIDLSDETSDSSFFVNGSRDTITNWKSYRIPLRDSLATNSVGDTSWQLIKSIRIWLETPDGSPCVVNIAAMELISSNWEDTLIPIERRFADPTASFEEMPRFNVAVINTQENIDYEPPPGVEGYENPQTGVREPEQSLLLHFNNFARDTSGTVADTGMVEKDLLRIANLLGYQTLKMHVHGPPREDADSLMFFFRIGADNKNYYEFQEILEPGWRGNDVIIDFNEITGFKEYLLRAKKEDPSITQIDSTEGNYRIFGEPNIAKVKYIAAGVVNLNPNDTVTGDIWLDELHLTDVRRDAGLATRLTVSGNVADLFTYNAGFNYMNSFFRKISGSTRGGGNNNLGSGKSSTSYNFGISFKLDRFLPRALSANIPVSLGYSKNVDRPKLRFNSDIILPVELRDEESTIGTSKRFSISESFNKKTKNILFVALLNNIRTSFSYNRSDRKTPAVPTSMNETITSKVSYGFNLRKTPNIRPFFWTKPIPLLNKLQESKFFLLPNQFSSSGDFKRNLSISRNSSGILTSRAVRDFNGSYKIGYKISENLNANYNMSTRRDLTDLETVVLSFNPKKFKLGREKAYNQSFGVSYNPIIFIFLSHKLTFSTNYRETFAVNNNTRNISAGKSYGIGGSFDHKKLFGVKSKKRRSTRARRGGDDSKVIKIEAKKSIFGKILGPPASVLGFLTGWIDPVTYDFKESYSYSYVGLLERAQFKFRFGLSDDIGALVDSAARATGRSNVTSKSTSYSFKSGTKLFGGLKADVSFSRSIRQDIKKETNPRKTIGTTFPDINFSIRPFTTFKFFNPIIKMFSPRTKYSQSKNETIDLTSGNKESEKIAISQSPFLSFNFAITRGLNISFSTNKTVAIEKKYNSSTGKLTRQTKNTSTNTSISTKYSFSWPAGFKIPLLGRIRFRSTMGISIDVAMRKQRPESAQGSAPLVSKGERTDFQVTPRLSYAFSQQIKGSISARWQDTDDKQTKRKSHVRELRIEVDIRF